MFYNQFNNYHHHHDHHDHHDHHHNHPYVTKFLNLFKLNSTKVTSNCDQSDTFNLIQLVLDLVPFFHTLWSLFIELCYPVTIIQVTPSSNKYCSHHLSQLSNQNLSHLKMSQKLKQQSLLPSTKPFVPSSSTSSSLPSFTPLSSSLSSLSHSHYSGHLSQKNALPDIIKCHLSFQNVNYCKQILQSVGLDLRKISEDFECSRCRRSQKV